MAGDRKDETVGPPENLQDQLQKIYGLKTQVHIGLQ